MLVEGKDVRAESITYPDVFFFTYSNMAELYTFPQWLHLKHPILPFFAFLCQKILCKFLGNSYRNNLKSKRICRAIRRFDKRGLDFILFLGDTENVRAKALCMSKTKAKRFYFFQELPLLDRYTAHERLDKDMLASLYRVADRLFWRECDLGLLTDYAKHGTTMEFPLLYEFGTKNTAHFKNEPKTMILVYFGSLDDDYRPLSLLFAGLSMVPDCLIRIYTNYTYRGPAHPQVSFHTPVSYEDMSAIVAESDALFCIGNNSAIAVGTDSKFISYLKFKKPLILIGDTYNAPFFQELQKQYKAVYRCCSQDDFKGLEEWLRNPPVAELDVDSDFFARFTPKYCWSVLERECK